MKIGALYIRVSTHMQEELSPESQKKILLEYAKANDIYVPNEYIFMDLGISGRKAEKRPDFQRMITLAKSNPSPFQVIVVWKFSRFARNQEESIVYKSLLNKQCGVEVISKSESIIDGPFGSLIERIIEWFDEFYSLNLSEEVFRGMKEKASRGGFQARPPLGYKIEVKGEPPVIVEEEAKIVRIIFDKYVNEHMGLFAISRYLNSLGLKTSHNKPFERRSIEYIIQNPTYCGMIRWNRTENETNRIKDKDEWIVEKGLHEPIISQELFDAAQERFNSTYQPRGARPSCTYKHWLSGLIKCPACGRTMICQQIQKKSNGEPYAYFTCYGYSKGKCNAKNSVSSLKLEPAVLSALKNVLDSQELCFESKAIIPKETVNEQSLFEEQLKRLTFTEKRMKEAYLAGVDTLEEYKLNKIKIEEERKDILEKMKSLEVSSSGNEEQDKKVMLEKIGNVYEMLQSANYSNQQKNEMLRSIVEKIVYTRATDTLEVYYYLPKAA